VWGVTFHYRYKLPTGRCLKNAGYWLGEHSHEFLAIVNFYLQPNIFIKFVDALWSICGSAKGALRWMLMRLTEMALFDKAVSRSWIDAVEATADFVIGLTALLRFFEL
jgi:hypothetical protein